MDGNGSCYDGFCIPWIKTSCRSCGVRPFHIYQGNGNTDNIKNICSRLGIHGVMVTPGGCSNPTKRFDHFALDNGAFSAFHNRVKWDGRKYKKYLERHLIKGRPDFIITPDLVAGGLKSLKFSLGWNKWIRKKYPDIKQYLAVQDGMLASDVGDCLVLFDGLFIGGTLCWKYSTSKMWASVAHDYHMPCHIGRVGTSDKIVWARLIVEADSIDSTSWARNNSWHHIEYAKTQQIIDNALIL